MKGINLVTRADEAGLNRTVNKAIRSSVKQGIVRNISLLAPAPAIAHAAESFDDLNDEVDFGLQLCLTAEWENLRWGPVAGAAQVPGIVRDDGTFPFSYAELAKLNVSADEIMLEAKAQYEKLVSLGFHLVYLVAHQEIEGLGGIREKLADFSAKNNLIYAGNPGNAPTVSPLPGWAGPGEHPGTELADHLATLKSGTYLLAGRPAFKTEEMENLKQPGRPRGAVLFSRNRERRMFADIEIVDYCENAGIQLFRYSSLQR